MFQMRFNLDPKSVKKMNKLDDEIKDGLLEGVRKSMFFVEAESKKKFGTDGNLKVKTGRLRSSINTKVQQFGSNIIGSIGSNVFYASIHELGSSRIPARPFLAPAIEDNLNTISNLIMDSIMREVK